MRASSRPILLATLGIAAAAVAFAVYRSRVSGRRNEPEPEELYVAALDGVVGQPSRLLPANLPRPRLRLPRFRRGG